MSQNFTVRATGKSVVQAPTPTEKAQMPEQGFTEQDWRRLLISLGENPDRAGLVETPSRVAKAWKHWTSGYAKDPAECLKVFEDGAQEYNERLQVQERLTIQIANALMAHLEPQAVGVVIRCRHLIHARHTATQPRTARGIFPLWSVQRNLIRRITCHPIQLSSKVPSSMHCARLSSAKFLIHGPK